MGLWNIYYCPRESYKMLDNYTNYHYGCIIYWMYGWSGPSRGRMPASATDNLLPRQCLVYSDFAWISCYRTFFFRHVDNPTDTRMCREGLQNSSAYPVLG